MHRSHSPTKDTSGAKATADPPTPRRWLNLGVLAHVDAGKTSLTEALLHAGGALERIGRVDDGTTRTDTLALERRRGITIRSAVASFTIDDVTINLIDTPGHPDFIAEVDRSLTVLDGAILVLSAVEGVQAQTIVLYRALRRLGIPVAFFINKIDRFGADPDRVIAAIRRRLTTAVIPLGTVREAGTADGDFLTWDLSDPTVAEDLTAQLADHDRTVLETWVNHGRPLDAAGISSGLRDLTRQGLVQPLLSGSAVTGAGVSQLIKAVTTLLPTPGADREVPMAGQVFKIERSTSGGRVCYVRLRAGTISVRDQIAVAEADVGKATELEVCEPAGFVRRERASAGQVVRVHGLSAQLGDRLGEATTDAPSLHFAAPALETTVTARNHNDQTALHQALTQIADFDPLIKLRPDEEHRSLRISIYGEVQQQVIADTLELDYGLAVDFRSTKIICVERPAGIGHAARRLADPDHLFASTIGVSIAPNQPGAGTQLIIDVPRTSIPLHVYSTVEGFHDALLGYLDEPLAAGPHGWRVVDVIVTVTESGYIPPDPMPVDVRRTAGIVVAEAIRLAGTVVCEPIEQFSLETPQATLTNVLNLLGRHRAHPQGTQTEGTLTIVTGTIPTAELDPLRRGLHGAAHGEAIIESHLDHYDPQS